jgi:CelD/BcsL family acetyltransferase involved in cellulose biosynthesis
VTRVLVSYEHAARAALDDVWDNLVRAQERPNPTMLAGWLGAMIDGDAGRLVAVRVVDEEGRLLAAAMVSAYRPLGRVGPSLARWPGDPETWFDPDILVRPGHADAGVAVVEGLLREVHALHVPCLEGSALDTAVRARDPGTVHTWSSAEGWMSPIPVPRDGYARTRVARDVRAAERKQARIETTYAVSPSAISEALERLFDLHYAFWSKRSDWIPRFSATSEARALHRAAVDALARSGDAYITEVRENGEVTASGLALRAGSGLVCHTSATRRDTQLRTPGHARMLATMDHAASLGVAWVDLGPGAGGPASTKHRIGALPVPIQRTLCARSRVWLVVCRSLLDGRDRARNTTRLLRRLRPGETPAPASSGNPQAGEPSTGLRA